MHEVVRLPSFYEVERQSGTSTVSPGHIPTGRGVGARTEFPSAQVRRRYDWRERAQMIPRTEAESDVGFTIQLSRGVFLFYGFSTWFFCAWPLGPKIESNYCFAR